MKLLNELLLLKDEASSKRKYDVVMWIDGDACVVRPERRIEQLFANVRSTTDLIIAEDMTPACLVSLW